MEQLVGDGAVDHAVVVAQGDVAHAADGDGIVDDHRALFDHAQAQDADVGLADHWQAEEAAEDARVGDGKGAFLNFFGFEFFGAGAFGQIVHGALDAQDIFFVGVLYDGYEQAPIEGYGDADIHFFVDDHVGAIERGVERGESAQTGDRGFNEEGHEGEFGAVAPLKFIFRFGAQAGDLSHVDFVDGVDVR